MIDHPDQMRPRPSVHELRPRAIAMLLPGHPEEGEAPEGPDIEHVVSRHGRAHAGRTMGG